MSTGASFTVEFEDQELRDALAALVARMEDTRPFLKDVGQLLMNSVQENFRREQAPDGTAWTPLSSATIRSRMRSRRSSKGILRRSGMLYGSIAWQLEGDEVRVGASTAYAAIHQFGGTIERKARTGTVWHGRLRKGVAGRRFAKKTNKTSTATPVSIGAHKIIMPARPYLGVSAADERDILDAAERWLMP